MFTRVHKILLALLAAQIALAVVTLTHAGDATPAKEHPLLAGFDAAKVTRVQIASKDGASVDLAKKGSGWVIASGFDYPVPQTKIESLMSPIAKLSAASPVATKADRHKQLHVANDEFERKLVITANGKDTTLYVGTTVGSRRSALRIGGDDRVWPGQLSAYAVSGAVNEWMDDKYIDVPQDDIAKVTIEKAGETTTLERDGDHWKPSFALAAGETLDANAVSTVIGDVGDLPPMRPGDPKRDATHPTATITIERKPQDKATPAPVTYDVIEESDGYWVKQRGAERPVVVSKTRLADALAFSHDRAVTKAPPKTAAAKAPASASRRTGTTPAP